MLTAKPLVLLMWTVLVSTVAARTVNDILQRFTSERHVEFCPLDPDVTLLHCINSDGDPITGAADDDRMPAMSACVVVTEHEETFAMTCLNNGLKIKTTLSMSDKGLLPLRTPVGHRQKRWFFLPFLVPLFAKAAAIATTTKVAVGAAVGAAKLAAIATAKAAVGPAFGAAAGSAVGSAVGAAVSKAKVGHHHPRTTTPTTTTATTSCQDLNVPENGAIACEKFPMGTICQAQCKEGFDIYQPRVVWPVLAAVYVCSDRNGTWLPTSYVADCVENTGMSDFTLGVDTFNDTGDCNSTVKMEIKKNFIKTVKATPLGLICGDDEKCRAPFVSVDCGESPEDAIVERVAHSIAKRQTKHVDNECIPLRRPHGATAVVCNETELLSSCHIQCRAGFDLPEGSPSYYNCGAVTNYRWSHQTDDNPIARLPSCSAVIAPVTIGYTAARKYDGLTCEDESVVLQQLNENLGSTPCASSPVCSQRISTNCSIDATKESSTDPLYVTIAIKSEDLPPEINIQELFVDNTASARLVEMVEVIANMEITAQEMLNDTSSLFNVTVNGRTFSTTESVSTFHNISCKAGSAPSSALCVESPMGSYSDGLTVIMCEKGTYQDETGSTSCKPCPSGFTTLEPGAESVDECSGLLPLRTPVGHRQKRWVIGPLLRIFIQAAVKQAVKQTVKSAVKDAVKSAAKDAFVRKQHE